MCLIGLRGLHPHQNSCRVFQQGANLPGAIRIDRFFPAFYKLLIWLLASALFPAYGIAALSPTEPLRHFIQEVWQTPQGLPQESVLAIAQTSDGYLWLGTEEGLVRFDGVRFVTVDTKTLGLKSRE